MPTAVLATKLFAPVRRPQSVVRERLLSRLDAALDAGCRLVLLSAPAGFGKTTVLGDWLTHVRGTGQTTRTAWLSLDAADNDPSRFLTHLVAALKGVDLDIAAAAADLGGGGISEALTVIVNDLTRAADQAPDTRWVQVLDDYHLVESPEVHEAVTFLLDHSPAQLHLVMATRSDPPLPLARLRARGQLVEVRAADLRLTPGEAGDFLNEVMGLDLTAADVDALEERTEGWLAGLQLAGLSLQGMSQRAEVAAFIDAFTGSNRFVIDYLADEVLSRQPEATREFLLRTAVLDGLTGPLCDAVTGRTDGARTLERLDRGNLFVVPLDAQRSWYRYHHLFADVLRARLLGEHPHDVPDLHRRASAWYAAHGMVADAVRHALAANDFSTAAHLIEVALADMRRTRQDGLLLTWTRSLPEAVVRRSPVLCILSSWSMLIAGDLDGAQSRLDDADAALAAGALDPDLTATWADTEDLRSAPASISLYRASLAQARGDVDGTLHHARRAMDLAAPGDHFVRGAAGGFIGLASWAAGDVEKGLSTFSDAVQHLDAAGNRVDVLDSTIVLADMWLAAGRPSQARRLYTQALRTATSGGDPYPRATADLHVGLAELDRELDDLAPAEAHLERARVLGERARITENRHRWHVALALVRAATGDVAAATRLLDEADALYRGGFYPDVRPIAAVRARVHIAHGDPAAAEDWVREHGITTPVTASYLREYDHLTLVRLLLARHRRDEAPVTARTDPSLLETALVLLDLLLADAEPGRPGSAMEIRLLRALVHQAGGQPTLALGDLRQALERAPEPDSYVRLFLDEGDPMLALLQDARDGSEEHGIVRQHACRILDAAAAGSIRRPPHPHQNGLLDPLSARELDVLRLLDSDLSGPQIARELYVSLNTLRTHTKRIFTKLDVKTRVAAVRRAREHGLL